MHSPTHKTINLFIFNHITTAPTCYPQSSQYTQTRRRHMPSDLKSETSRINGAKSHGPKTPEGKETSSQNSLKHGFTSRKTLILKTESPDEYQEFLAQHIAIHQPTTLPESES